MGLQPAKTSIAAGIPVWQGKPETASGGFTISSVTAALLAAAVLAAGTPVKYDESTRQVSVLKTAKVYANATNVATTIPVEKGHHLKVGDNVAKAVGGAAYAISAIDTSNASYDSLTVATTLGVALTAGDVLFQSSANGASAAALNVTPNGLVYEDTAVEANASLSVVIRGTVYARRIPGVPSTAQAAIPNLIFSQSF